MKRLDERLIDEALVPDRRSAFVFVTEGKVFVNGQKAVSPSQLVGDGDRIEVRGGPEFVGRGALKLQAALDAFKIDPAGLTCVDIGAATGGFTDVLLTRGARKVYAIDAGRGKLALKLRRDKRVVVMEGTNILALEKLPEPVDLIVADLSLTPLEKVLPKVRPWLTFSHDVQDASLVRDRVRVMHSGAAVVLFKPQYEVQNPAALRHGILANDALRAELIARFRAWLACNDWRELGMIESPIRGGKGNLEYLFWIQPA